MKQRMVRGINEAAAPQRILREWLVWPMRWCADIMIRGAAEDAGSMESQGNLYLVQNRAVLSIVQVLARVTRDTAHMPIQYVCKVHL